MPRSLNQKSKLYQIIQILTRKSDKDHYIGMDEIIADLSKYGISAERKSIYTDLDLIREQGYDVQLVKSNPCGYYMNKNIFTPDEITMLYDSIMTNRSLRKKDKDILCKKVLSFTSKYISKHIRASYLLNAEVSNQLDPK